MCRRFRRQSAILQRAGRLVGQADKVTGTAAPSLSEAARERIKQTLAQEGHGGPA
jgi:hypothetical protein